MAEPRKSSRKKAPSAKAHEGGSQKAKKTSVRSWAPKSKASPKTRKQKTHSDNTSDCGSEEDDGEEGVASTSKKHQQKRKHQRHRSPSTDETGHESEEAELIDKEHESNRGDDNDEVCIGMIIGLDQLSQYDRMICRINIVLKYQQ